MYNVYFYFHVIFETLSYLSHLILWFPLQGLKHPEHVEGELGELDLIRHVSYYNNLLERQGHDRRSLHRWSDQGVQPVTKNNTVAVRVQHVGNGVRLDEGPNLPEDK